MAIHTSITAKCGVCGKFFNNASFREFFSHLELEHGWNIDDWDIEGSA